MEDKLQRSRLYLKRLLHAEGEVLSKFQTSHIMILYFVAHGLDLLDALSPQESNLLQNYVLSLQIPSGGWSPSSFYTHYQQPSKFDLPHIVFTYSAINILQITGGLGKINKTACLESVQKCEKANGAYSSFANSKEADLRFVYSAVCICYALGDFSRMNKAAVVGYIRSCFNFDGGYSLRPHCQSHSGAIYCALASLKLLGEQPEHIHRTLHFLVNRQIVNLDNQDIIGIQGRVGKLPDSCYSFWVGSSILMASGQNLVNPNVQAFIELCFKQNESSFSKYPENKRGDPVHTVHSIVGTRIAQHNHSHLWLERGIRAHPHQ